MNQTVVETEESAPAEEGSREIAPWKAAIVGAHERFVAIARSEQLVDWQRESMFALQALERNDYLMKMANENPASLRNAIINVAACGITLNPAAQYAALVPRDGSVCLDIMYRGLLKIATDAGSIRWAKAELVYDSDRFSYKGPTAMPTHEAEPFSKTRGEPVGVYCVAKTVDGDILCDVMSADDVNLIRDRSPAWMRQKKGPWKTDWGEMAKKTIIKRARKTWPETKNQQQAERLQTATELANIADGFTDLNGVDSKTVESSGISPHSGAAEALSVDQRNALNDFAAEVEQRFRHEGAEAANAHMASQSFDVEEQVYLWGRLVSSTRTALRKAHDKSRGH